MNAKQYQDKSKRTLNEYLNTEQTLSNMALGLIGEIGEVADIIKKHLYQGHQLDMDHIKEEIGDVMFYMANLCNTLDLDLETLLEQNYAKLLKRYPEGFNSEQSVNRVDWTCRYRPR